MVDKFRNILEEAAKKAKAEPKKREGKMLKQLHVLDDQIEDFIDSLEDEIIAVEGNPVFVKKAHQLLADMSKEYSEFIVALRAIVNAVDRKEKIIPAFEKQESRVRDVLDGQGNGPVGDEAPPPEGDEAPPEKTDDEYELKVAKKGGKIKEALLMDIKEASTMDEEDMAFKEMLLWLKNMKSKISKTESSAKRKVIDGNVTDTFMRLAKVDEEKFFSYFWG